MTWNWAALVAAFLAGATALYINQRWRRAPQAFTAMVAVAICYFVAGAVLAGWILHLFAPSAPSTVATEAPGASTPSVAIAPAIPPTAAISDGTAVPGRKFTATVTDVLDGDTVDVTGPSGAARIRLTGIDA